MATLKRKREEEPLERFGECTAAWRAALAAARQWLVVTCGRGDLTVHDEEGHLWALFRSQTRGYLYYSRAGNAPIAVKSGLTLRPRGPGPESKDLPALLIVRPPRKGPAPRPVHLVSGPAVAQGAFAQICLATDGQQTLAVKRALRPRRSCTESVHRDEHFLRLLRGNRHVVRLLGSYLDEQHRPCLLLPAAAGDLGRLPPATLVAFWDLVDQLAQGLAHVHSRGVVHLDVKPGNVLVFEGDLHCLADFGSATRSGHALDDEKLYECTRPYRPPEIVFGAETAAWPSQDLWSLGVLLWQSCPEDSACPLLGAQNGVEQAALVLALAGVSPGVLRSWRFSPQQADACCGAVYGLDPFCSFPHTSATSRLRKALLRPRPAERSLASLLSLSHGPCGAYAPEEQTECT